MQKIDHEAWIAGIAHGEINLHTVNSACGFATYPDWFGFNNRKIDYFVLYMPLKGVIRATFHDINQMITVQEGTILIIPPQSRHSMQLVEPDYGITTYHFRFYAQTHDYRRAILNNDFLHVSYSEHRNLYRDIARVYDLTRTQSAYATIQMQALWMLIFTEIFHIETTSTSSALTSQQRTLLDQYITHNIHLRPTPEDLANVLGYSKDYFSRTFKRTYGVSPRRWIVLERIRRASAMLLETEKSITQIAHELGYNDVYLFSRQFKQIQDYSPQKYRQMYGQ